MSSAPEPPTPTPSSTADRFARMYAPLTVALVVLGGFELYLPGAAGDGEVAFTSMWAAGGLRTGPGTFWVFVLGLLVLTLLYLALTASATRVAPILVVTTSVILLVLISTYREDDGRLELSSVGQATVATLVLIMVVALLELLALAWAKTTD